MADNWMDIDKDQDIDTLRPMSGSSRDEKPMSSLEKAKYALKETLSWAIIIAVAVVLSLLITRYVIFKAVVPTGSMKNTIEIDDKLVGWQLFSKVNRGDVIIFLNPDKGEDYTGDDKYLVKRVIGLPGETIEVTKDGVYINNKKLDEDYVVLNLVDYNKYTFGPYEIPDNSYFLMGDNRNQSADARFWENKNVTKKQMVAKVVFKYSPKFKLFKKIKYNL